MFNFSMGHFLFLTVNFHSIFTIVRSSNATVPSQEKSWLVLYDQRGSQSVKNSIIWTFTVVYENLQGFDVCYKISWSHNQTQPFKN